jgi:NAD(P)-dependent dehydrogenase (short-subunit alcohol dehydrogenase family)
MIRSAMTEQPLKGQVALVTGSSRGIGRGLALALARRGADVVVTARTEAPRADLPGTIHATADEIRALGRRALAVRADLLEPRDIDALVQRALAEFGQIDVLVNNAAEVSTAMYDSFWEMSEQSWRRQLELNLTAPFLLCRAVAPSMRERRRGLIVNISSGYGRTEIEAMPGGHGSPGVAYGASKAGLDRLTLGLAKELRPFGIAVVSVDPGFTLTEHCTTLGPAGGLDTSFAHPVEVPVRAVLDVVCAADPLAYSGQCLSAAPPPPFARQS